MYFILYFVVIRRLKTIEIMRPRGLRAAWESRALRTSRPTLLPFTPPHFYPVHIFSESIKNYGEKWRPNFIATWNKWKSNQQLGKNWKTDRINNWYNLKHCIFSLNFLTLQSKKEKKSRCQRGSLTMLYAPKGLTDTQVENMFSLCMFLTGNTNAARSSQAPTPSPCCAPSIQSFPDALSQDEIWTTVLACKSPNDLVSVPC